MRLPLLALLVAGSGLVGYLLGGNRTAPPARAVPPAVTPDPEVEAWVGPPGTSTEVDEEEFDAPVVSLSLGDTALFRYGGLERKDPTRSIRLKSGDAIVFGGPARLIHHGIDRLIPGSSDLLPQGGRLNLTLRKVEKPL